ncbi:MAG: DUF2934 domain-containing protein [Bacteroidetes bacterium]|nr:MAG: DUF2934 domain-containing protein [Bacteroidota bacterium]
METLCEAESKDYTCPIRETCYRYTTPVRLRDRYLLPYDFQTNTCDLFVTNIPDEEFVRLSAYHIWLREGQQEGKADEHWQRAYDQASKGMNRFLA